MEHLNRPRSSATILILNYKNQDFLVAIGSPKYLVRSVLRMISFIKTKLNNMLKSRQVDTPTQTMISSNQDPTNDEDSVSTQEEAARQARKVEAPVAQEA
ncbi:Os01g0520020 [Oryza sativa Japonica Group]|uniref:Os01g0520020 protein n=1 Tax=Oryza sativa subsp. japonica TaxID=39947 RepID=A0A0P0V3C2_ORYSJ|nr:Os01g0520020 [Oryza sativa Japonica Group]